MTPTDTIEQGYADRETLWVTDAELIRRSGVPEKIARATIRELDKHAASTGFPQKDPMWGDRRFWPDVIDWWKDRNKRKMGATQLRRAS